MVLRHRKNKCISVPPAQWDNFVAHCKLNSINMSRKVEQLIIEYLNKEEGRK